IIVLKGPSEIVRGKHMLLIDGVIESGDTIARATTLLREAGAASVKSAVAVVKPHATPAAKADYAGFTAGHEFLYGYGMDRSGQPGGLTDIRIMRGGNYQNR